MKRYLIAVCLLMSVLLIGANSYAQYEASGTMTMWGRVTNSATGEGLDGAHLILKDPSGFISGEAWSSGGGYYAMYGVNNFCNWKSLITSLEDFRTNTKTVTDDSCCDCPNADPIKCGQCGTVPPEICGCTTSMVVNVKLTVGTSDVDQDGYYDLDDNCPYVPNGPRAGTCTKGSRKGLTCYTQNGCGCGTNALQIPCDMFQTDTDHNGIGDVCEAGFLSMSSPHRYFDALGTGANLFAGINVWWSLFNYNTYDTIGDAVVGVLNGPDMLCSTCPTHDFNKNGIGDEWEGGLPEGLTMQDYIDGFYSAVDCCQQKWEERANK